MVGFSPLAATPLASKASRKDATAIPAAGSATGLGFAATISATSNAEALPAAGSLSPCLVSPRQHLQDPTQPIELISLPAGDIVGTTATQTLTNKTLTAPRINVTFGTVDEFIVINGTVDTTIRQKLEGYLAHKWGTLSALPAAHSFKTLQPMR